jgi:hypothetical protein
VFATASATTGTVADSSKVSDTDLTTIDAAANSALLLAGMTAVGLLLEAGPAKVQQVVDRNKVPVTPYGGERHRRARHRPAGGQLHAALTFAPVADARQLFRLLERYDRPGVEILRAA